MRSSAFPLTDSHSVRARRRSSTLAVRSINDFATLSALAPEWRELWARAPGTPFQSPAWLLPWWRVFAPGELRTLALHENGRLIALAPFYLEDGPLGRRILMVGIGATDYLDILCEPGRIEEAGRAIVEHLAAQTDWDAWELTELPPEAAALQVSAPSDWEEHAGPVSPCPVLDLTRAGPDLAGVVPKDKRRRLRRARRLAHAAGEVAFRGGADFSPREWTAKLFRLHTARWTALGQSGLVADQRMAEFVAAAADALWREGLARFHAIEVGGNTAAVFFGMHHGDWSYAYFTGFEPALAQMSPGALLLAHAIEQAIGEGAREIHFLRGAEPYKYKWGAVDRWNTRRTLRRRA